MLLEGRGWGRFLLELPPSDMAFCPLSSTSHCAVVFWGYFPSGAWSHEGREETFLKTRSCSSAVLEAAGSGLCDAPLGGAVERTGEGFSLTLFSCLLFAPSPSPSFPWMGNQRQPRLHQTLKMKQVWSQQSKGSGEKAKATCPPLFIFFSHPPSVVLMELGAAPAQAVWPEAGIHSQSGLDWKGP